MIAFGYLNATLRHGRCAEGRVVGFKRKKTGLVSLPLFLYSPGGSDVKYSVVQVMFSFLWRADIFLGLCSTDQAVSAERHSPEYFIRSL